MDIAQTTTLALTLVVIAVLGVLAYVGVGLYRARYAAAREDGYRELAARSAESAQATADALAGLRTEIGEVRQRLAALEKLLSQIG